MFNQWLRPAVRPPFGHEPHAPCPLPEEQKHSSSVLWNGNLEKMGRRSMMVHFLFRAVAAVTDEKRIEPEAINVCETPMIHGWARRKLEKSGEPMSELNEQLRSFLAELVADDSSVSHWTGDFTS
jgi:hypothetical protein